MARTGAQNQGGGDAISKATARQLVDYRLDDPAVALADGAGEEAEGQLAAASCLDAGGEALSKYTDGFDPRCVSVGAKTAKSEIIERRYAHLGELASIRL